MEQFILKIIDGFNFSETVSVVLVIYTIRQNNLFIKYLVKKIDEILVLLKKDDKKEQE